VGPCVRAPQEEAETRQAEEDQVIPAIPAELQADLDRLTDIANECRSPMVQAYVNREGTPGTRMVDRNDRSINASRAHADILLRMIVIDQSSPEQERVPLNRRSLAERKQVALEARQALAQLETEIATEEQRKALVEVCK
jgi:hypothetical protein